MKKLLFIALFAGTALASCTKEETPDTQKPVITVTSPAGDHLDTAPGQTINLSALLTDNEELLNAKIDIHEAGDHGHRVSGTLGFEWAKVYVISGKEHTLTEAIEIPADAEIGEYHITFEATDRSGNAATPVVIEMHIE